MRRAFTMLELMVASAMALIVVTAATSSVLLIIRTLNRSGESSAIVSEVQLLSEFLVAQSQGIGGGAVRPWMVTVLKNNVGAGDSDVFAFGDLPATVPASSTLMQNLGNGAFSLFVPTGGRGRLLTGRCGLADLRKDIDNDGLPEPTENTAAGFAVSDLVGREVILVSPSGETWRSVVLTGAGIDPTPTGCFVRFAGSDAGLVANGFFVDADQFSRSPSGEEDLEQWVGGQVAFVRAREWSFEPAVPGSPGKLVERLKEQGAAEERVLFEGVLDLQVAIGYDHDPFDGLLRESIDGRGDEWVNQTVGDSLRVRSIPGGLAAVDIGRELLRMIEIGVVVALPRAERQVTVRALDGEPRTGPEARVVGGRSYLRNLLLFL
jgi:prepilin-type N-terminal cleavage/methylation domain-containing protein